jgi:glutamate synthase domain-containing protein 2
MQDIVQPALTHLIHPKPIRPPTQVLTRNELRERVVVRVDGGVRNGRDVLITAALGADEYGFGTVAMIATGCIMARVCHTNNCPVGVASQREELRARFPGTCLRCAVWLRCVAALTAQL